MVACFYWLSLMAIKLIYNGINKCFMMRLRSTKTTHKQSFVFIRVLNFTPHLTDI
jgi:hypothetical protein